MSDYVVQPLEFSTPGTEFVAAFDPPTVLALLDQIEAADV